MNSKNKIISFNKNITIQMTQKESKDKFIDSNSYQNYTQNCQEFKNKYEKCMKNTSGNFEKCMNLLTQSFWCSVEIKNNS